MALINLPAKEHCLLVQRFRCLVSKARTTPSFESWEILNPKGLPTYLVASPSFNHCTPRLSPQEKFLGNEEAHIHLVLCTFNLLPEAAQYKSRTLKTLSRFSG